jgi:hypothetical protein
MAHELPAPQVSMGIEAQGPQVAIAPNQIKPDKTKPVSRAKDMDAAITPAKTSLNCIIYCN